MAELGAVAYDEEKYEFLDSESLQSIMKAIIEEGDYENLTLLLENSPDCTAIVNQDLIDDDDEVMSPLHYAVKKSQLEICKLLIEKGSDMNAPSECTFNPTPLHLAIDKDVELEILKLLISEGANIEVRDELNCTPLQLLFMEPGPERQFQFDKFKLLLDSGADVKTKAGYGSQPLHGSVKIFHSKECEDIHDSAEVPLCVQVTKMLIEKGADVNCVDDVQLTPLHYASDCDKVVEFLLENGALVNTKTVHGFTPLHNLARYTTPTLDDSYDNEECFVRKIIKSLDFLLAYNAEINTKTSIGENALHFLVSRFSSTTNKVLEAFLKSGADINARTTRMETPLHYLCLDANSMKDRRLSPSVLTNLVEIMIAHGADVEAKDINGYTPLASALLRGDLLVAEVLLNKGASSECVDKFGRPVTQMIDSDALTEHLRTLLQISADCKNTSSSQVENPSGNITNEEAETCEFDEGLDRLFYILQPTDRGVDVTRHVQKLKNQLESVDSFCENKLNADGIGRVMMTPTLTDIQMEVDLLINRIADAVKKKDSRMAFTPALSGSMIEGTKIGNMDEFDYILYMDHISDMCDITEADSVIPGFVQITARDSTTETERQDLFRESDRSLIANIFGSHFYRLIQEVLGEPEIWESLHFYWEEGPLQALLGASWVSSLSLKWAGKDNEGLTMSIDLAPVIHSKRWRPRKIKEKSPFLRVPTRAFGNLVVISKPAPEHQCFEGGNETYLRLSFSHVEKHVFLPLPEHVKSSYILAKVLLSKPVFSFLKPAGIPSRVKISSYMLKMAMLAIFEEEMETITNGKRSGSNHNITEIRKRTSEMFSYIAECIKGKNLPSYFLPEQNILQYHQFISLSDRVASLVLAKLLE